MVDTRRKRLLFRSLRRGTKESDLVVGGFAKAHLQDMSEDQLDRFEALLDLPDQDLLGWIIGQAPIPRDFDHDVMAMMCAFKQSL